MVSNNPVEKHSGLLRLNAEASGSSVMSVHRDTAIGEVADRMQDQHYVLATDDSGRLTGIASSEQIMQRLGTRNHVERNRWEQMPLSALLNVTFSDSDAQSNVRVREKLECVAVSEGDQVFGLAVDDDIFLSWRRLESLLSVALSDPLTKLFNRLAYERRLLEEWQRAHRNGTSVAVVVVDLDNFKRINDTLGHPVGDMVLSRVGRELEASMRSYDVVARFGGDEFVALCLGCDPGNIAIPIDRIRGGISCLDLSLEECPVPVTASIGAAVRHDGFEGSDPRELFSAADECLYHAKASSESAWRVEIGKGCSGVPEPVRCVSRDRQPGRVPTLHSK